MIFNGVTSYSGMSVDAVGFSMCSDERHDDKDKNLSSQCCMWYTDAPDALEPFLFLALFITTINSIFSCFFMGGES